MRREFKPVRQADEFRNDALEALNAGDVTTAKRNVQRLTSSELKKLKFDIGRLSTLTTNEMRRRSDDRD